MTIQMISLTRQMMLTKIPNAAVNPSAAIEITKPPSCTPSCMGRNPIVDFTLRLGKRIMARADFAIQPRSYIRPTLSYVFRHNDINLYQKGEKYYNMTYNQHTVELQLINFNTRNFNVNAGAKWDYYHYNNLLVNYRPESQMELFDNEHFFVYQAQVDYNSENHWFIPTKGAKFTAKFGYYTDNFVKLKNSAGMREYSAMWRMSFPVNNILTIQPMLYGRLIFGTHLPSILGNVMGGSFFSHYVFQQIPFPGVAYIERARDKAIGRCVRRGGTLFD